MSDAVEFFNIETGTRCANQIPFGASDGVVTDCNGGVRPDIGVRMVGSEIQHKNLTLSLEIRTRQRVEDMLIGYHIGSSDQKHVEEYATKLWQNLNISGSNTCLNDLMFAMGVKYKPNTFFEPEYVKGEGVEFITKYLIKNGVTG